MRGLEHLKKERTLFIFGPHRILLNEPCTFFSNIDHVKVIQGELQYQKENHPQPISVNPVAKKHHCCQAPCISGLS